MLQGPQRQKVKSNLPIIVTNASFLALEMVVFSRKLNIILISELTFAKTKSEGGSKELCICSLVFLAKIFGYHFTKIAYFYPKNDLKRKKLKRKN